MITLVNVGSSSNDGTGDSLRTAFIKINDNFADIDMILTTTDIVALAANVVTLQTDVANIELDIASIESDITTIQTDITDVQADVATNSLELAQLETDLNNAVADVAQINLDIDTIETDIANNDTDIAALQTSTTNLQTQITSNDTDITNLGTQQATNTGDITQLQTDVTNLQGSAASLQTQITANDGDITALQSDVTDNTSDITQLQTDVGNNDTDIANINTQLTSISSDITDLENEDTNLQTQITANDGDITALQTQQNTNTTNIGTLQTDLNTAETNITNNDTDIAALQAQQTTNTANIATLQTDVSDAETDIAALQTQQGTNTTNITALQGTTSSLQSQITSNDSDISQLQTDVSNLNMSNLQGQITDNANDITQLQTDVGNNDTDIAALQTQQATNIADITQLQSDVIDNADGIAQGGLMIATLQAQQTTNTANISQLQSDVANNDTDISQLQTDVGNNDTDIAALQTQQGTNTTNIATNAADITALEAVDTSFNARITQNETDILGKVNLSDKAVEADVETSVPGKWVDAELLAIEIDRANGVAVGETLGLEQKLLAEAGQPGLTVLAVGFTDTGKVQGVSLGRGNVVEVYANGTDFNDGNVLYREFMDLGEPICFTGLTNGAIITSSEGFYGMSEQQTGTQVSPMPLLSYGLAFKQTFFFAFRNSNSNEGRINVVNGPNKGTLKLTDGSGTTILGQENIILEPWQFISLQSDGNQEYILDSTQPIMACIHANMDAPSYYDSRLIMPLTNDGITWPRNGQVSAQFANTSVDYYVRDGAQGTFTVNPGSPVDFDGTTGATDQDYEPNGATRVLATGIISAFSGADSAGLEATPMMPTAAMSQVVAQPFFIADNGDGGNSGVAIASPYEGTALVYSYDTVAGSLVLEYTVPITRASGGITTEEDQFHPAAGLISNDAQASNTLVGQLDAGIIIADVPITVVAQNGDQNLTPTIRSQNGTTTTSLISNDDETLMLGITPDARKAQICYDANGLLRRKDLDGAGTVTYPLA